MSTNVTVAGSLTIPSAHRRALQDPLALRIVLISLALGFVGLFLVAPLAIVFLSAFSKGLSLYFAAITEPDAISAIKLTLTAAGVSVACNTLFGLFAAWAVTKFNFIGKGLLITLIDLPFSVSPVISGMIFVLLFGSQTFLGGWLAAHDIRVLFNTTAIVMATTFVTFPFVARELIPIMQALGTEEEEAARALGASGLKIFFRISLPNAKWGLIYGIIICNARAMGEFGAVSVVSGHIRGVTNTIPLHIEILYNEYNFVAAFAVSSLLALLALITLAAKGIAEWKTKKQMVMFSEGAVFESDVTEDYIYRGQDI